MNEVSSVTEECCEGNQKAVPGWWSESGGSVGKESACSAGDLGLIPGLGRSPGEGKGYLKEETDRPTSLLKAGLHLGPDCGL